MFLLISDQFVNQDLEIRLHSASTGHHLKNSRIYFLSVLCFFISNGCHYIYSASFRLFSTGYLCVKNHT